MAKKKERKRYVCQACGHETTGWLGRCPACGQWNTLEEVVVEDLPEPVTSKGSRDWLEQQLAQQGQKASRASTTQTSETDFWKSPTKGDGRASWTGRAGEQSQALDLDAVEQRSQTRVTAGLAEMDRVLGGGFVPGSMVLVGGDPGIGKSTLLLQVAAQAAFEGTVLYVNGEESPEQLRQRADRLHIQGQGRIKILADVRFERIVKHLLHLQPQLLIIDSIQTLYSEQLAAAPGTVAQVRETAGGLLRLAKQLGITIVLVGHVTKDGALAGPRVLEHMVDTVLYFEGERYQQLRLLRAVKNRFGATNELAMFEMTSEGLQGVQNASEALLAGRPRQASGSVLTSSMEGTRPLLLEVQALLTPSSYPSPQRQTQGLDRSRMGMLMAVLEKSQGFAFGHLDAYVNVVGGLRVSDTASDLAVAAAIASSCKNQPVRDNCLVLGELGLSGELRPVLDVVSRVREAARCGLEMIILPSSNRQRRLGKATSLEALPPHLDVLYVDHITEAFDVLFI